MVWENCICEASLIPYKFVGLLRPGGTVVEGTAGNTGIGLAHMCLGLGYKCVIYMPNNQSQVSKPYIIDKAVVVCLFVMLNDKLSCDL